MVDRTIVAFDSAALTVAPGSPSLTPGSSIINNSNTPNGTIFQFNGGFAQRVTINDTSSNTNVFEDDDEEDHVINYTNDVNDPNYVPPADRIVANGTEVESESRIVLRALDEFGDPTGPRITLFVFSKDGDTSDVWGFSTNAPLTPGTQYVKVRGSNNGDSTYTDFYVCFAAGTRIRTPTGDTPVETLRPGDRVWTTTDPALPLRWVGHRRVAATGTLAPIEIAPGCLGNPRPLRVSAEHRLLIGGPQVEMLFGEPAVLVAAKNLLGLPGVTRRTGGEVAYTHLLFDTHRLVEADGALAESFYPTAHSLPKLTPPARAALLQLHPDLPDTESILGPMVAPVLRSFEAGLLSKLAPASTLTYAGGGESDAAARLCTRSRQMM